MKIGIIIYSKDPETAWNGFRFATFCAKQGDEAQVFLLDSGVESEYIEDEKFNVVEEIKIFAGNGGKIWVCGTCLGKRNWDMPRFGEKASLANLYEVVAKTDKVVSF